MEKDNEYLKKLLDEINQLRDELEEMANRKNFDDPTIIKKSLEIDEKLNIYNRIINDN